VKLDFDVSYLGDLELIGLELEVESRIGEGIVSALAPESRVFRL